MSDSAPPCYERDLKLCESWKYRLFTDLGIESTPRNDTIFEQCCEMIAFSYENNRNDDARFEILKRDFEHKYNDPDSWAHLR